MFAKELWPKFFTVFAEPKRLLYKVKPYLRLRNSYSRLMDVCHVQARVCVFLCLFAWVWSNHERYLVAESTSINKTFAYKLMKWQTTNWARVNWPNTLLELFETALKQFHQCIGVCICVYFVLEYYCTMYIKRAIQMLILLSCLQNFGPFFIIQIVCSHLKRPTTQPVLVFGDRGILFNKIIEIILLLRTIHRRSCFSKIIIWLSLMIVW